MPEIKLKHVVSCSSADTTHTAENLLKPDTYRKWKAKQAGEKQISVILQFEKEEQIHSIDIGNEGSAFVEVLVGHSTSVSEQEYEVILGTSSFMSPSESKSGSNLNRTRMFGPDKLVKASAEKRWDRVKIVCTQPYTKNLAYGLSFIRFHSPPDKDDPSPSSPKVTKLGQFKVKEEENSASMRPGALFFSRTTKTEVTPPKAPPTQSYASAALHASGSAESSNDKPITKTPPSSTTPKEPSSGKRKYEFNKESSSRPSSKVSPSGSKESSSQPAPKKVKVEAQPSPPAKKTPTPEKPAKRKTPSSSQAMDLHQLLQGTVFVLSGFQNPFRSDLRDKALEMGAKYRPDWTPDSTHLICAFANTPKYSQVKAAGGIIVRKEWILDCYQAKQRLPHKKYLVDGGDSSSEEDSEEDSPPRKKTPPHRTNPDPSKANHRNSPAKAPPPRTLIKEEDSEEEEEKPSRTIEEDLFGGSTDDENPREERCDDEDSGGDTEDELRKMEEGKVKKEKADADPYAGSTDENTDVEEEPEVDLPIPELPDLFVGKRFFLYGEFPPSERRTLQRYIVAFSGELEEYIMEKVQYVITAQ
ncbi:DNA repair protein XRCC1 isoform X3 [Hyperolius riggenbachi]|uniref:DNA repair protein XRCC1 isoform X3 n=1 Tax=Hyperolius riggenbachi TaxID=752182 RepID=UPI0035A28001